MLAVLVSAGLVPSGVLPTGVFPAGVFPAGMSPFAPRAATAQISGGLLGGTGGGDVTNPLTLLRQRLAQSGFAASGVPMEGVVDPDVYMVGPGDAFSVTAGGQTVTLTPAVVSNDGILTLPDAGSVVVGGLTLARARDEAMVLLRAAFQNVPVTLSLVQSRQFYVHVSGAVPRPGRYLALPVARVSSILEQAFADTVSAPVTNPDYRPSLRNVRILHTDGTESGADLLQYFTSGDRTANPYLRDGDVLFVPAYEPARSSVYIGGAVPFPGSYDYRTGDTVADLIALAGGLDPDSARRVRVVRTSGAITEMSALDAVGSAGRRATLQVRDRVDVVIPEELLGQVHVSGSVLYPGSYPVVEGETTLRDLVNAAGGLRAEALPRGAYLERRSLPDPRDRLMSDRFDAAQGPSPAQLVMLADTTAIMQRLRLSGMDFMSRAYFAQEWRLQNRVSIDMEAVLAGAGAGDRAGAGTGSGAGDGTGSAGNVFVKNGDRLVIPRNPDAVYVFGQVARPGYVTYELGLSAEDYIARAGGAGENSKDIFVVHPGTGQFSAAGARALASGDMVFVDRENDMADSPELQRVLMEQERIKTTTRLQTWQTVASATGTLASVLALIISIRRQ